jgi:glycosyltransferase involved in cell wall biosynthesis
VTVLSAPDCDGNLQAELLGGRAFLRAARIGRRFDRIVVHFQPALYYRPRAPLSKVLTSLGLWWLVVRRPTEIIVHEADRPVRWRPDYALLRAAFARAAAMRFHTRAERLALESAYGITVRGSVIPHLVHAAIAETDRDDARRALGIDPGGPVFVIPGFIQPSKGIDRALPAFQGGGAARLWVVGSVRDRTPENDAYVQRLRRRTEQELRMRLIEQFLGDEEFDRWIVAADWVLLPYRTSWSSGVLARAHALGTPALVTAVGGLAEQAVDGDVVVPNDDEGILRAIDEAATVAAARERGSA